MQLDRSYGIIPLRHIFEEWEALLVKHGHGHWAFPKGHADLDEEPLEAAVRELREETGLEIGHLLDTPPLEEKYVFRTAKGRLISKTVTYFLAEVKGKVVIQVDEITDFKWNTLSEASQLATFPATKELCKAVQDILASV